MENAREVTVNFCIFSPDFGPRRREDNDPARGGAEGGIIVLPTPRAEIRHPPDSPCRKQIPDWLAPIFSIKKRKKIWRTPFRPDASGVYFLPISFHEKIVQFYFKIFVKSEWYEDTFSARSIGREFF